MSGPGIIGDVAPTLSPLAKKCGAACARRIFNARGNHSEIHLSELDLALVAATAADVAINLFEKRVQS